MLALLALLLAQPGPAAAPADVAGAIAAALAIPGARAEVGEIRASGPACAVERAEALRPVSGTGEVPVRLAGRDPAGAPCERFAWARVRVLAPALRTTRVVRAGEPIAAAVVPAEAEVRAGRAPLAALPAGALAARALRAGDSVFEEDLAHGPPPGAAVEVLVRAGAVELTQVGHAVACARGLACALLPGGRRVEGRYDGTRIIVEAP
jgi:hypothetical protein